MANQIPFSEGTDAAGGYLIPDEQAGVLTNGILSESGAANLAGDKKATSAKRAKFTIWLGRPTASFVGEGAAKPVTGGEFGQAEINVKKIATIVLFTDEQVEDVQNGDLDVFVDTGVRTAIAETIDAHIVGKSAGTNITTSFDNAWRSTTQTVEYDQSKPDALRLAISAAMGKLEANGYGNPRNMGLLLTPSVGQDIRDARTALDTSAPLYRDTADAVYQLQTEYSTNLSTMSATPAATKIIGFVVYKPNVHLRIRKDITVDASRQATVNDGTTDRHLWQENLSGVLYETRQAHFTHDLNRAVVALVDAA